MCSEIDILWTIEIEIETKVMTLGFCAKQYLEYHVKVFARV